MSSPRLPSVPWVLAGSLVLLMACANAPRHAAQLPEISVAEVGVRDVSMEGATLQVTLVAVNRGPVDMALDGARVEFLVAEQPVASAVIPVDKVVGPGGEVTVPAALRLTWAQVPGFTHQVLRGEDLPYRLRGEVALKRPWERRLPFERGGRLPLPRVPRLTLERSSVERAGLGVAVRAGLRVENPNPFPIAVEVEGVQLVLAGAPLLAVAAVEVGPQEVKGERELELGGKVDLGALGQAFGAALRGEPLGASLSGTMRVGSLRLPFLLAPPAVAAPGTDGGVPRPDAGVAPAGR